MWSETVEVLNPWDAIWESIDNQDAKDKEQKGFL